eukprot:PhM_4_TR16245/c0_g1_i1/m.94194
MSVDDNNDDIENVYRLLCEAQAQGDADEDTIKSLRKQCASLSASIDALMLEGRQLEEETLAEYPRLPDAAHEATHLRSRRNVAKRVRDAVEKERQCLEEDIVAAVESAAKDARISVSAAFGELGRARSELTARLEAEVAAVEHDVRILDHLSYVGLVEVLEPHSRALLEEEERSVLAVTIASASHHLKESLLLLKHTSRRSAVAVVPVAAAATTTPLPRRTPLLNLR